MYNSMEIDHPCFSEKSHFKIGRVHLPVAPKCNISCNFCDKRVSDYFHASRPGLTSKILKPEESINVLEKIIKENPFIEVIGIAGPGESLYNEETFETLKLLYDNFPSLKLCVCTNGLLLPNKINSLKKLGVEHITITINAVEPEITAKINRNCIIDGKRIEGLEGAKILIKNQLEGLKKAKDNDIFVKINTVLIPNINTNHVKDIAYQIQNNGADIMNIMPLIPLGRMKNIEKPNCQHLKDAREKCEQIIPNFRLCKQCRADAYGIPGLEGKEKCL